MSLTKDDLLAIRDLMDETLEPIKIEQKKQGRDIQYLKKKVNKIEKTVDIIGRTYDERINKNTKDIEKLQLIVNN